MNTLHTYTFPEAKNIVICGDIHGEFNSLIYKLCIQYQLTDTLLIVAGDCGFGFEKSGYYEQVFNRNSSRLSKSNNWIVMMRGNHDDPSYFSEEKISHQRFRTVPDYSVIQACVHNILCVGVPSVLTGLIGKNTIPDIRLPTSLHIGKARSRFLTKKP